MRIVTAEEMYAIDRYTIEHIGISEESLMENAGQAVAKVLLHKLSHHHRIAVIAGIGNNGGDGFVVARVLKSFGYITDLWLIPPKEKLKGAAKQALTIYERSGYEVNQYVGNEERFHQQLCCYDVIIDAMLGIGVKGPLRSPYKEIIEMINKLKTPSVYAIDIPSGIPADGGAVDTAIQADVTITIQSPKLSAYLYPTADFYGEVITVDIGIPPIAFDKRAAYKKCWTENDVVKTLPRRPRFSHKGTFGKGMVIGGSRNMSGAITMTAKAALRSGAGLLTMAIPDDISSVAATYVPEVMYYPCPSERGHFRGEIDLSNFDLDAAAIGPGMGRTAGTKQIVKTVLEQEIPVVLDADALYFWKDYESLVQHRTAVTVLTPHPGEMARMLDISVNKVENNRFGIAKRFATEYGVYLVLKGPYTIITTPEGEQFVNTTGNPALAKGGSGDVLTGMIVAFLMQHQHVHAAICNAIYVHGKAADELVQSNHSPLDVLASDVIDAIPKTLFDLYQKKHS
jgi:ADP-dependent NAD(P)H-hydrate dehydratase / NAD(P)H-hydrate epimerase